MTVFVIGPDDEARLRIAAEKARTRPIPWEVLKHGVPPNQPTDELTLADRVGVPVIPRDPVQVILPLGWRVSITCEQQPAGFLLHVSMSSPAARKVPSPEAMEMLVKACGYKPDDVARIWFEEYEPGKRAVNVLILLGEQARRSG